MAKLQYTKTVLTAGFESLQAYILSFGLPVFATSLLSFFILQFFFSEVPLFIRLLILLGGTSIAVAYPFIAVERLRKDINENLHLFITYAATISTLGIQRNTLFEKLSQQDFFGYISKICARIHYFAMKWTLGFAAACHNVSQYIPSKVLADFIDRFGVMIGFGEELSIFLMEEQDAVMDGYALEYRKSLENIRLVQEIFVSVNITVAFLMAIALLFPLITGISMEDVLIMTLFFVFMINLAFFVIVISFIPQDRLVQISVNMRNKEAEKTRRYFLILGPISLAITIALVIFSKLPFLFNVFLGTLPMVYVGYLAVQEERLIEKKEKIFPEFIRTVGAALAIKRGELAAAIESLKVHNFGVLNEALESMYRRVKVRTGRLKIYFYFSISSGSNLIYNFVHIFSEATHMGGDPIKISEIVSKNFTKVLSLRKLRLQLVSNFRGAMYGVMFGLSLTTYVASQTSLLLANLFTEPFADASVEGADMLSDVVGNLIPGALDIDVGKVNLYIGIMLLVYAITCSLLIKIVDGGRRSAAFVDFSILIFIGALASWLIPMAFAHLQLTPSSVEIP